MKIQILAIAIALAVLPFAAQADAPPDPADVQAVQERVLSPIVGLTPGKVPTQFMVEVSGGPGSSPIVGGGLFVSVPIEGLFVGAGASYVGVDPSEPKPKHDHSNCDGSAWKCWPKWHPDGDFPRADRSHGKALVQVQARWFAGQDWVVDPYLSGGAGIITGTEDPTTWSASAGTGVAFDVTDRLRAGVGYEYTGAGAENPSFHVAKLTLWLGTWR